MKTTTYKKTAPATALVGKNASIEIVNPETNNQPLADPNGGQPSNRPPLKVTLPDHLPTKILASGVDTLVLSVTAFVFNPALFETFDALKKRPK